MNAFVNVSDTPHNWRNSSGGGCWGDKWDVENPVCALPYEDWSNKFSQGSKARGAKVKVTVENKALKKGEQPKSIICELRDSLPHRSNCKGVGIALNPAAIKQLAIQDVRSCRVTWEFVEA